VREHLFVLRILLRVAFREFRDFLVRQLFVRPHEEGATIRERRERRRRTRQHLEAVFFEFEIANDFRAEETVDVGGAGDFAAGPNFFGDAASAENVAAFEDEDFLPRLGEIRSGDEAVVARANNDRVVGSTHEGWIRIRDARVNTDMGMRAFLAVNQVCCKSVLMSEFQISKGQHTYSRFLDINDN
jgi:hypothetical protein